MAFNAEAPLDGAATPATLENLTLEGENMPATVTYLSREYIWGPGDWGVDELLVQYDQGRRASWPLQDAGGDVIALCDLGGTSGTARISTMHPDVPTEPSMWGESMAYRRPSDAELRLLHCLLTATQSTFAKKFLEDVMVEVMEDGGMGSLRLRAGRDCGRQPVLQSLASECRFKDIDGVDVIASLYVNKDGVPFELDVWKVTFGPLLEIPATLPSAQALSG